MQAPVPDEDLLSGKHGEIGGLVMIKRDLARARLAGNKAARMDGFYRTDEEQRDWQIAQAELYDGLEYEPHPLPDKGEE